MTGVELDAIKSAEDMRVWEEMHKDDPKVQTAVALLQQAVKSLEEAESFLQEAAEAVEHVPETDRIASLHMTAQDLECDIRAQIVRMK